MHWTSFIIGVACGAIPVIGFVIYLLHTFSKMITIRW